MTTAFQFSSLCSLSYPLRLMYGRRDLQCAVSEDHPVFQDADGLAWHEGNARPTRPGQFGVVLLFEDVLGERNCGQ